ncbi:MAG: RlmI/RlmK family 23S rRNA methyltransferase, partial [Pseudomonadota bacterium]
MTSSSFPVVRLRPNVRPQAIKRGAPWVYDNELVTDRRTKALQSGAIAVLQDAERTPLALVTVNPASRIIARVLDLNTQAVIDQAWVTARIERALTMRSRLFTAPFYRL